MKTRKFCPKCGRPVVKSNLNKTGNEYKFQCHGCEEDFWRFEVYSTKQIDIVRNIRKKAYIYERKQEQPYISFKQPYPPIKHQ